MAFQEPEAAGIHEQVRGYILHAPDLLPYEVASAARKKMLKTPKEKDAIFELLVEALALDVVLHKVNQVAATRVALEQELSSYDASYAWLARGMAVPLVTLDKKLQAL